MYEYDEDDFDEDEEELEDESFDEGSEDEDDGNISINLPLPHAGQQLVLDSKARFKVLLCGRRWGKTQIAIIVAINAMLKGERIAYVTPEYSLGNEFFKEIVLLLPTAIIKNSNKADRYISLITGGDIRFFSGENLDSFRGRKFHKVILDEAAFISDLQDAWYGSIRPTLSDYKGEALFISTPRGMNFFYSLYLKGKNREKGYESWHFPTNTNPYFPKGEFEEARSTYPEAKFNEEYLAIPNESGSNPFGAEHISKNIITEFSDKETIVYGVDVASYNDWSVIIGLDMDGAMTHFDRFKLSWEQTYDKILQLPADVLKVVDATGVGDVLFERLKNEKTNVQGFKFSAQSKTSIVNQLISEVQKGLVKYTKMVADEMFVFEQSRTSTGYIKFEAQKGFHDDCVMALAIAVHHKYLAYSTTQWKLYTV